MLLRIRLIKRINNFDILYERISRFYEEGKEKKRKKRRNTNVVFLYLLFCFFLFLSSPIPVQNVRMMKVVMSCVRQH